MIAALALTLDCILSFREHLTKTAEKLKNRNNLLMKLAGSSWGANAETLRASALCYPVAEYCAPVWSRSPHTGLVDIQLNFTMRIISRTLHSTPLPWLPVLANIEPPALRRKAATAKLVEKIILMTTGQLILYHQSSACLSSIQEAFVAGSNNVDTRKTGSRLRWSTLP